MKWTSEKPTKPGWYWRTMRAWNGTHEIVRVIALPDVLHVQGIDLFSSPLRGFSSDNLWSGPIKEPTE